MGAFEYKAFISYSHRDTAWAQWLLNALETYRLPESTTRGVGRVFRDRDEAGAASDLKEEIQRALLASEHLIVVASPNSARSKYVEAEIRAFDEANRKREKPGHILTLIVGGEPNVSSEDGPDATECFPPALRGGLLKPDGTAFEPLAADARAVGDGKTRALAKLVSGLMDIRYDMLVRRDLQRRRRAQWLGAAAAVAVLAIVVVVTAIIAWQGMQQEELRRQQAAAQRDARTVTAVNNAERARRLLSGGNITGAVELARQSLDPATELPFIPQAYSVLYAALYQRGDGRMMDFGSPSSGPPVTVAMPDKRYMTITGQTASIWSAGAGITYRRSDLEPNAFRGATEDGSSIYIAASFALMRYRAEADAWDRINTSGISFEHAEPTRYIVVDDTTLLGVGNDELLKIRVPAVGPGDAEVESALEMPENTSGDAVPSGTGTLLIGTWSGKILEIDPIRQETRVAYETGTDDWVTSIHAAGNFVVATTISNTFAFRAGNPAPILMLSESVPPEELSPSGRFIAEQPFSVDHVDLIIHDLETNQTRDFNCNVCRPAAFMDDTTLLTLDDGRVVAYDVTTGQPMGDIFVFPSAPDRVWFLPDIDGLLGFSDYGPSMLALLDDKGESPVFLDANDDPQDSFNAALLVGDDRVVVRTTDLAQGGPPYVSAMRLYARRAGSKAERLASAALDALGTGYSEITGLPGKLFAVFAPTGMAETSGRYTLFDATDGAKVYDGQIDVLPIVFGENRYYLLGQGNALNMFDAVTRHTTPLLEDGESSRVMSRTESRLAVASGATVRVFDFDEAGPKARESIELAEAPVAICLANDGNRLYALSIVEEGAELSWRDLTGSAHGEQNIPTDAPPEVVDVLLAYLSGMAYEDADPIDCSADRFAMRDYLSGTLVWTPSANSYAVEPLASEASIPSGTPTVDLAAADEEVFRSAKLAWDETALVLVDPEGNSLARIDADGSRILSAIYVPSRALIAAGLENGLLRVWDAHFASAPMIELQAHGQGTDLLSANAEGTLLLSGTWTGDVKIWPLLTSAQLVDRVPQP
ncbi:MAG TPA: TIR domain-containing protein [Devosia sp.]|nr:TIR domain-containing protein [Devosia sp.]